MGRYFKPLRRKLGVLTLVLACVFMAGWVRSWSFHETVSTYRGEQIVHSLFSGNNWILWRMPKTYEDTRPATFSIRRDVSLCPGCELPYDSPDSSPTMRLNVHYSVIVIPLTLLSACLLLSRSRKAATGIVHS